MEKKFEQLKAILSDEALVKSCIEAENEEAVQKLFAGKGIEISQTELELFKEMVSGMADGSITKEQLETLAKGGELSEDELEQAAGGITLNGLPLADNLKALGITGLIAGGIGLSILAAVKFEKVSDGCETAFNWVKENITRW